MKDKKKEEEFVIAMVSRDVFYKTSDRKIRWFAGKIVAVDLSGIQKCEGGWRAEIFSENNRCISAFILVNNLLTVDPGLIRLGAQFHQSAISARS